MLCWVGGEGRGMRSDELTEPTSVLKWPASFPSICDLATEGHRTVPSLKNEETEAQERK